MNQLDFYTKLTTDEEMFNYLNDFEKQNKELTILNYILLALFLIVTTVALFINKENSQLKKDIVIVVGDVAERQAKLDKWDKFEKEFIPETALPRRPDIEAIYNERT